MKKISFIILLMMSSLFIRAQDYKQLDHFFDVLNDNNKIMGSFKILNAGQSVYEKIFGYQFIKVNKKSPISADSKFRIGSITKTFTAVMAFQLVDEGKLSLKTPLFKYFPKIKNASKITIANLLNHSSGLFNITVDEDFNEREAHSKEEILQFIRSYNVDFKAGSKNEYSNTNFILLGYILEAIEGKPYKALLKNRIVDTIGLKNTFYGDVINENNNECLSYFYEEDNSLYEAKQAHLSNPGGAGAIVSNPNDLTLFYHSLFNGKLISPESLKIMTTIKNEMGSGILSAKVGETTIYAHNGTIDAFRSMVVYMPEYNVSLALNTNALNYSVMSIMLNAVSVIKGDKIEIPQFNFIEISQSDLKKYAGTYACEELPFNLVFKTDGKTLKGSPEGQPLKTLKAIKKDEISVEELGVLLKFDLKTKSLNFIQPGQT